MIYLFFTILSSTAIYVVFKGAKFYSCELSGLITLNYIVAAVFCFAFLIQFNTEPFAQSKSWLFSAIVLGIMFIIMFYLIGNSSQKAGITVTTLANKLSLVFPVLFSLIYFNESISFLNYLGLGTAVLAVFLTVYKKEIKKTNLLFILLPLLIFVGSGLTDSVVKYAQALKIGEDESAVFSFVVFMVAFICGIFITLFVSVRKNKSARLKWHLPTFVLGSLLGLVNFGSLYFIINALNKSTLESSLVFAIVNMSIVLLSSLIGRFIFKEKLDRINYAGIVLAILSLYFLL